MRGEGKLFRPQLTQSGLALLSETHDATVFEVRNAANNALLTRRPSLLRRYTAPTVPHHIGSEATNMAG